METLEVEKDDCRKLADFLNSLRSCVGGSPQFNSMIHFADGIRWLQDLAVNMAKVYAEQEMGEPKDKPKKEGFTVKNYSPGASE